MTTDTSIGNSPDLFKGILPGKPAPFFLSQGEGEKSVVFDNLFTILLSAEETDNQYGVFVAEGPKGDRIPSHLHLHTHEFAYIIDGAVSWWMDDENGFQDMRTLEKGDFVYIPANTTHAYRIEENAKMIGAGTAGFERFFHAIGKPTEKVGIPSVPDELFIPPFETLIAAGQKYGTVFKPDFKFAQD